MRDGDSSLIWSRYMNAAKYGLDRVFFGGCFIRGECLWLAQFQHIGPYAEPLPRPRRHYLNIIICYSLLE